MTKIFIRGFVGKLILIRQGYVLGRQKSSIYYWLNLSTLLR